MKKFTIMALFLGAAICANAQTEQVIFEDDFSWLLPWANLTNANGQACGDPIGSNSVDEDITVSRALNNIKAPEGSELTGTAAKAVEDKGYELLIKWSDKLKDSNGELITIPSKNADNATYLQRSLVDGEPVGAYLKFGLTNYSAGITTPALDNISDEGATNVKVSFQWCPMRAGNTSAGEQGAYDTTHLSVLINGITTVGEGRENVPDLSIPNTEPFKWYDAEVDFGDYVLKKGDKITIRPGANQWPETKYNQKFRWFFRNLKVTTTSQLATSVVEALVDDNAPVEYYNLQGMRVAEPENGLYIVKQGNKVSKKIIRK